MKKTSLIMAIAIMAIGFAAISTTLIINGNTTIMENVVDFDVIFTGATLDNTDVYANVVSQDKQTITFTSNDLKKVNDTSVLEYVVTNNSSNYDAEVVIECNVKEGTTAEYTSITNALEDDKEVVKAKESVNGTLTIKLDKASTSEVTEEYTCELIFYAAERNTLGASNITYYYAFGTPTTSSTTNYETLNKNVFVRLGSNHSKAICIVENDILCLESYDYANSVNLLREHFGESNCDTYSSSYLCYGEAFSCGVYSNGYISCDDNTANEYCVVDENGATSCS